MFQREIEAHFKHLIKLVRLEEAEENAQFQAEFLQRTPEQREQAGKALLRLDWTDSHFNAAGHRLLTFQYQSRKPLPLFSLDVGDMVCLSRELAYNSDLPFGTVYDRDAQSITVAFSRELPDWAEPDAVYHLYRAGNRATYRKTIETLRAASALEHGRSAALRTVLLGLKPPAEGDSVKIEKIPFFSKTLNPSQKRAVQMVLESPDLSLIQGPPGTGKTTVLVEIIRQAAAAGQFVFATAPSNAACDHLLKCLVETGVSVIRLGHPARILSHLREHTLDFRLANHPHAKMADEMEHQLERLKMKRERRRDRRELSWEEKRQLSDEIHRLKAEIKVLDSEIFGQVVRGAQVMVGTHLSGGSALFDERKFDLLVMDESAQGTEPSAWIPILNARKIVLAGDHFQLPPTVRSPEAEQKGLRVSLFERLHGSVGEKFKALLTVQYRMHEDIMTFSSREFYGGALEASAGVRRHVLADLAHVTRAKATEEPFVFLDTAGRGFEETFEEGSQSRYNAEEAALLTEELDKLLELGVKPDEIAVISPYSAQIRLLRSRITDPAIQVDSIDSFQGQEKEAVLLSLVRSNVEGEMGFLTDTRRMNVAMTRARRKLVVIGDSATLSSIPFYHDFIQYAESVQAYRSSWESA